MRSNETIPTMTDVRTNPERLWSRLMDIAEVGATPAGASVWSLPHSPG